MSSFALIEALRDVFEAKEAETKARDAYDGYEWDYHGFSYAETTRKAEEKFGAVLDDLIDKRISFHQSGNGFQ